MSVDTWSARIVFQFVFTYHIVNGHKFWTNGISLYQIKFFLTTCWRQNSKFFEIVWLLCRHILRFFSSIKRTSLGLFYTQFIHVTHTSLVRFSPFRFLFSWLDGKRETRPTHSVIFQIDYISESNVNFFLRGPSKTLVRL